MQAVDNAATAAASTAPYVDIVAPTGTVLHPRFSHETQQALLSLGLSLETQGVDCPTKDDSKGIVSADFRIREL
jgi:hypothetical protein